MNILYSLITFIIAIFFIMLGIVSAMLPWSTTVRTNLVQFILEDSFILFLLGSGLIIVGLAIIANIVLGMQHRYYNIKSENHVASLDEKLFQQYLNVYWKELFPNHQIPHQVILKGKTLHVTADLPQVPISEQKQLIGRIENDLNDIFSQYLGYNKEFLLSISFQK